MTIRLKASASRAPLVSVIIPVRNAKDFIQEAIDSVFCQAYPAIEIHLVDDGSDDLDYQMFARQDDRIHVTRLEGQGVSHARNTGMRLARGEYFAFLDADDVWFPGKLQSQIGYLERHPEAGIVFGQFICWPDDGAGKFEPADCLVSDCSHLDQADPARSGWIYTRLLAGLLVGMNTAVIRRDVYQKIGGFDESMRIAEDYDFWLRASQVAEMDSLNGPVALYRIHAASAMHGLDRDNHLAHLLESARARWGLAGADGASLSQREFRTRVAGVQFSHGYSHFWQGDPLVAMQAFSKAFAGGSRPARSLAYCLLSGLKHARQVVFEQEPPAPQLVRRPVTVGDVRPASLAAAHANVAPARNANRRDAMPRIVGADPTTPLWARMLSTTLCGGLTGRPEQALTIFTFHKVPDQLAEGAGPELTLPQFQKLIPIVQNYFRILPLEEGIARLQANDLPPFSAALTFDDGYPNWLTGVVPILEYNAIPATFFISTCQLEGNALWFERLYKILDVIQGDSTRLAAPFLQHGLALDPGAATLRDDLLKMVKYLPRAHRDSLIGACEDALDQKPAFRMFDANDLKMLQSKGFSIGAHTVNHPILACCSDEEARTEIVHSKEMLQDILREPVTLFSYPNGVPGLDIQPAHIRMVQNAGFRGAVTTALGAAAPHTSIFQLPRFDPWARTPGRLLIQYLMMLKRPFPMVEETFDAL